jgi:ABC-type amino acid transport substrate-binding protein
LSKYLLLRFALVLLLFCLPASASSNLLIFNRPADTPQARYVIDLLKMAYKEIGYEVHIIDFNHQSALIAANNGILDGQLGRIADVKDDYPNLLKVDFPLFDFNLVLLKNCQHCRYKELKSLAIQSSYPAAQSYIDKHPFGGDVIKVRNITAQLNLLTQKRVEGTILLDFMLKTKHPDFNQAAFHKEVLMPMQSFHFVHKRHEALIPKLTRALQKLQEEGKVHFLKSKYNLTEF